MMSEKKDKPKASLSQFMSEVESVSPDFLLIYGPPKSGKTKVCTELPENDYVILDLERGTKPYKCIKIDASSPAALAEAGKKLGELETKPTFLVIDNASKLEDFATEIATRDYKASTIGRNFDGKSVRDLPNGAGYYWIRNAFSKIITHFKQYAQKIIVIAHIRTKELGKDQELNPTEVKGLQLTSGNAFWIASEADAIGRVYRKGPELMIEFLSNEEMSVSGSRYAHIEGKQFVLKSNNEKPADWSIIYPELKK